MSEPYCRVYWSIMDDPKFDGIRDDVRALGTWLLCLVVADMAYPAPAYVPPVPRQSFRRLVSAGLVDLVPPNRYRIHGLEAERSRRSEAARVGGLASGRSRAVQRPFNGSSRTPGTESNLAEPSRAETEPSLAGARARDGLHHVTDDVAKAWEGATGRSLLASGHTAPSILDELCERQGADRVLAAIPAARATYPSIPSPMQLAASLRNTLEPLPKGTTEPVAIPRTQRPAPPPVDEAEYQAVRRRLAGVVKGVPS